jgi:hypothetical protein
MAQFLAVTALGLFVSWLVHLWIGLFDNLYVAVGIWLAGCLLFAFIYDRREARTRRSTLAPR